MGFRPSLNHVRIVDYRNPLRGLLGIHATLRRPAKGRANRKAKSATKKTNKKKTEQTLNDSLSFSIFPTSSLSAWACVLVCVVCRGGCVALGFWAAFPSVCVCLLVRVARRFLQACMVVVRLLGDSCGPKDRFGNRTLDSLNGALGGANVLCIGRCGVMLHCNTRNCQLRALDSPIEPCLHPVRAVHWIRSLPCIGVMYA